MINGTGFDGSPKRKYQVFISSTFDDLKEHRQQATLGIVKVGHMPIALENYTPECEAAFKVIEDAIDDCQFYVVILGHRYGSIPAGKKKSYTELELDEAERSGLKVLAFVMDKDIAMKERQKLTRKTKAGAQEKDSEGKYYAFRERLQDPHSYFHRPFAQPDEIREELSIYFSREHDVAGYIREPKDRDDANLLEISTKNEIIREVVKRLGQFEKVDPRFGVSVEKKQAMARAFISLHGDHIENEYHRVFFESGSTISYLAKELSGKLPKTRKSPSIDIELDSKPGPIVYTNNAFAYLYLWLCAGVMCHPEPEGPPDEHYAGMYGTLTNRHRMPDYSSPPLEKYDPEAPGIIERLKEDIFGNSWQKENSIILAAASGLQISNDLTATCGEDFEDEFTNEEILKKLRKCRGFHVGSYENKLFKRCLYLTGIPTVVFIHDKKIDCPVRVGVCHFLFDTGIPWTKFIRSYPLSIWVACQGKTYKDVKSNLETNMKAGDWSFTIYDEAGIYPIVIGHNAPFRDACKRIGIEL